MRRVVSFQRTSAPGAQRFGLLFSAMSIDADTFLALGIDVIHHRPRHCLQASVAESSVVLPPVTGSHDAPNIPTSLS